MRFGEEMSDVDGAVVELLAVVVVLGFVDVDCW